MILEDLGAALGLHVQGDLSQSITSLAPIDRAGPGELAFVVSPKYSAVLASSKAGAVIVPESMQSQAPGNCLVSNDPYASYAKASWLLKPPRAPEQGIHPSAIIDPSATVAPSASIGPGVVIGAESRIEESVVIGAHSVIGERVLIGAGSYLFARVTIYNDVQCGERCRMQTGVVVGSEGFGYAFTANGWSQIQQTGGVSIGDRVHIGANTTIDCGAIDPTIIADGVILDNQIQSAHNVQIGEKTAIAGCVGIAGSTRIGRYCQIGGACNIVGHITIADQVVINAASLVSRSIVAPGRYGSGMPLQPERVWRRSFVTLGKLDELIKRVRRLERQDNSKNS